MWFLCSLICSLVWHLRSVMLKSLLLSQILSLPLPDGFLWHTSYSTYSLFPNVTSSQIPPWHRSSHSCKLNSSQFLLPGTNVCSSTNCFLTHNTSDTKCVVFVFSNQLILQLSKHQPISYNSVEFWHELLGVTTDPTGLNAPRLTPLHISIVSHQPPIQSFIDINWSLHDPLFGLDNLLEWPIELENHLIAITGVLERIHLRNSQKEEMNRASYVGRGIELPRPQWACSRNA